MRVLYELLGHPRVYLWMQKALGADRLRVLCLSKAALRVGERVLDLGCGPGQILESVPRIQYIGFDTEQRYIDYARQRYGAKGQFYCEVFTDQHALSFEPFDAVLLFGILHHIDDSEAHALLRSVALCLKKMGRVITLDPCFTDDQSRIARKIAESDRGRFVRRAEDYRRIVDRHFGTTTQTIVHNTCRVPSTEIIMQLESPSIRPNTVNPIAISSHS